MGACVRALGAMETSEKWTCECSDERFILSFSGVEKGEGKNTETRKRKERKENGECRMQRDRSRSTYASVHMAHEELPLSYDIEVDDRGPAGAMPGGSFPRLGVPPARIACSRFAVGGEPTREQRPQDVGFAGPQVESRNIAVPSSCVDERLCGGYHIM